MMEDKNPMVLGRLGRNPDVPTVTFYGHYDVQPAMEREWATDPFEIAAIDGYLYGRGTSDNKVGKDLALPSVNLHTVMPWLSGPSYSSYVHQANAQNWNLLYPVAVCVLRCAGAYSGVCVRSEGDDRREQGHWGVPACQCGVCI